MSGTLYRSIFCPFRWRFDRLSGLEMDPETVANATKMIRLATRSFQPVAKLVTAVQNERLTSVKTQDVSDCD